MAGNKVDGMKRLPSVAGVQIGGTGYARRKFFSMGGIAAPKEPHIVAKAVIPFRPPAAGEIPYLIGAARVPRFGDNLCLS